MKANWRREILIFGVLRAMTEKLEQTYDRLSIASAWDAMRGPRRKGRRQDLGFVGSVISGVDRNLWIEHEELDHGQPE